jgi:cyclohexanone monooxygenase
VAIIGTGSTAIQCVPPLAEYSQHLYVFQRTPASVFPRENQQTDEQWARSLTPGWQKARSENFTRLLGGLPEQEDHVHDWWTRRVLGPTINEVPELVGLTDQEKAERAMFLRMEMCRARVDKVVRDPSVAESLKPYYKYFCKRPAFHDEYLETFNRTNVTLVDTKGRGVDRITAESIIIGETEYMVDCIVYSTGFEFTADEKRRLDAEIYGKRGRALSEKFASGASTFQGLHTNGFPNLFRMGTVQTGTTFNYTHIATALAEHIAFIVRNCIDQGIAQVEADEEAEKAWVEEILTLGESLRAFLAECTPSYLNREGIIDDVDARNSTYGSFSGGLDYMAILEEWRRDGGMPGLKKTLS